MKRALDDFVVLSGADELMTVHPSPTVDERLASIALLADEHDPVTT